MWIKTLERERGAVLVIGLIMLLLLTIIGLAAIRGTDLQERMAGNLRDKNIAFQAAEAALRVGEDKLDATTLPSFVGGTLGYWPDLNKQSNYSSLTASGSLWPYWSGTSGAYRLRPIDWTSAQWTANSLQLPASTLSGVSEQPRYTIEKIVVSALTANQGSGIDIESLERSADAEFYRVTARGKGGTVDAEVVIQSTYAR